MKQYVIVGNGVAAAGCIEGIRCTDPEGAITVVSAENHPVYCRPLISYYLERKTTLTKMPYREPDFYEKNDCKVLYGKQAVKLEPESHIVILDNGTRLPYDSVCIAAGSSPFVPTFSGLDTVEKKFSFMTMDDATALETAIDSTSRVLIVGAGLIGLKCAEGIKDRVRSITVCDLANRVLSSILDDECAAIVQTHLEANGIRFLLGDSAASFAGNTAMMKSGKQIDFDVLVLAVGVRANTALVRDAGGEANRGILVNEQMQASLPDVFSAGDCTEGMDRSFGSRRVLAILPNAYMQGRCAGLNMAGSHEVFDKAIPMNSIGFFGLHAMTAGSYFTVDEGGQMFEQRKDGTLKRLFVKNGVLTGFILIGCIQRAGIYTALIRNQTPLDTLDFMLVKEEPLLAAFGENHRRKILGGVV